MAGDITRIDISPSFNMKPPELGELVREGVESLSKIAEREGTHGRQLQSAEPIGNLPEMLAAAIEEMKPTPLDLEELPITAGGMADTRAVIQMKRKNKLKPVFFDEDTRDLTYRFILEGIDTNEISNQSPGYMYINKPGDRVIKENTFNEKIVDSSGETVREVLVPHLSAKNDVPLAAGDYNEIDNLGYLLCVHYDELVKLFERDPQLPLRILNSIDQILEHIVETGHGDKHPTTFERGGLHCNEGHFKIVNGLRQIALEYGPKKTAK